MQNNVGQSRKHPTLSRYTEIRIRHIYINKPVFALKVFILAVVVIAKQITCMLVNPHTTAKSQYFNRYCA